MTGRDIDLADTYYGSLAGVYDAVASAPGVRSWRRAAVASLDLDLGATVVELGCGTGANLPSLREAVGESGRVLGVDIVPAMLGEARERIVDAGWNNVDVVRGDATAPPIGTVDAILSTFLVGMLEDPPDAVRTWLGLVRPGGRITLMNAGRSDRRLALPLNLACRGFVRLTAPGHRWSRDPPVEQLEAKWAAASDALLEGTRDHRRERMGGGFVRLASGRIPD